MITQLMSLQFVNKLIQMTLGFMTMRLVVKEVYGYVSIQVALFMSLSLFFAKEAVRKVAIRELNDNRSTTSAFNML